MVKKKTQAKEKRPIPHTVQQTIPYKECYENGVIQEYDGVFSKVYAYNDITFKSLSDEKQEDIYEQYQKFLNSIPAGDTVTLNFINTFEDFEDRLKRVAPAIQGDNLDKYRKEYTDILSEKLRSARTSIATAKYFTYSIVSPSVDDAMARFEEIDNDVLSSFEKICGEKAKPLSLERRLEVMHDIMNKGDESFFFEHDESGKTTIDWTRIRKLGLTTKDIIAPPSFKFSNSSFMIGERYGQTLFLDSIANWLNTNFLTELTEASFESCIALRIVPIAPEETSTLIKRRNIAITNDVIEAQKKAMKNNISPEFISVDIKNAKMQIDELQDDLLNRDQKMFIMGLVITHFADSEAELKTQKNIIKNIALKYVCGFKSLNMQQERGLFASMPFGTNRAFENIKRLIKTESLGVFMPFNEISCFDKGGYWYGTNQINHTPIVYNRLNGQNYNGLIFGYPGSGKSMTAKLEIKDTILSTNAQVCIIDPDGEYSPLAEAFGGTVIKVSPGNGVYLNPMDLDIDTTYDSDVDPIAMKTDFVGGLIETMLGADARLTPIHKSIVSRCIMQIYADYLASLQMLPPDANGKKKTIDRTICPTLQNLFNMLLSQKEPEAQNLAVIMEQYVTGPFNAFAHHTNVNVDSRLIIYDISDIGANLRDLGLKICLNDIWNRMITNRAKGIWTWAYVDEFHLLLNSPSSADFLKSIWKRARKLWGVPTGITQNVEDLLTSPAARAIINNTSFITMLNQSLIDRSNLAELLELSENNLRYITNAESGTGLIYTGKQTIPFANIFPKDNELYKIISTKAGEKKNG